MDNTEQEATMELQRVKGVAAIGDLVAYEDMANPKFHCRVELSRIGCGEYELLVLDGPEAGKYIWSDLRQYGWTFDLRQAVEEAHGAR